MIAGVIVMIETLIIDSSETHAKAATDENSWPCLKIMTVGVIVMIETLIIDSSETHAKAATDENMQPMGMLNVCELDISSWGWAHFIAAYL